MSDKKAEGPGNTLHLCSFRPSCREVLFSGGSLKKMVYVPLTLQTCAVACRKTNGFTFDSPVISTQRKLGSKAAP